LIAIVLSLVIGSLRTVEARSFINTRYTEGSTYCCGWSSQVQPQCTLADTF